MQYLLLFFAALLLSVLLVPLIKKFALKTGVVDVPNVERKIHTKPIPLLGGFAVYGSLVLITLFYLLFFNPDFHIIPLKFYIGMLVGATLLMIGGYLDDRYNIKPVYQLIFPILACLAVLYSGIGVGITLISNPFGDPVNLGFEVLGIPASGIFVFLFLVGMIYTTKFLDGMDGLASGIAFIAGLTLFFLSVMPNNNQSITASLAIIFCGAVLGFLFYNFNPASIFLGESGSTLMGFMLGVLAVLLGGKIATAVLVMGIPILDVAWVITRRLAYGHSPFRADRKHLHFRLLDIGFSQRQTVVILYSIAAIFGSTALLLQSMGKLVSLVILGLIMLILAIATVIAYKRQHPHIPGQA